MQEMGNIKLTFINNILCYLCYKYLGDPLWTLKQIFPDIIGEQTNAMLIQMGRCYTDNTHTLWKMKWGNITIISDKKVSNAPYFKTDPKYQSVN